MPLKDNKPELFREVFRYAINEPEDLLLSVPVYNAKKPNICLLRKSSTKMVKKIERENIPYLYESILVKKN